MSDPSRYHVAKQNDGRGWMLLRLDAIGQSAATIVDANMTESEARKRLAECRATEAALTPPMHPISDERLASLIEEFEDPAPPTGPADERWIMPVLIELRYLRSKERRRG